MALRNQKLSILLCIAAALGSPGCADESSSQPPNVVLIVIDTLRADHLPFHGYARDTAPFLSRLAIESVVFTQAVSPSSWTAPATASILSSLHPPQHGVLTGLVASERAEVAVNRIPETVDTMAEILGRAGYATFAVTDNLNICELEGFDQGFDRFQNFSYAGADSVNDRVLEWAAEIGSRPSLLYLHYMEPHTPYHRRAPWFGPWAAEGDSTLAAYDSEIRHLDTRLEQLALELDWAENTIVIVTSDHGEEFGEHGGRLHGLTLYQEVLHVPLIFRGAGATATVDQRVSTLDILPTLMDLLDLTPNSEFAGISLKPLLDDPEATLPPRLFYAHLSRLDVQPSWAKQSLLLRSVMDADAKLILGNIRKDELFDLSRDAAELQNQLELRAEQAAALKNRMLELEKEMVRFGQSEKAIPMTEEMRERLRALGYAQ